jgi:Anti-sigma-K factor rskA
MEIETHELIAGYALDALDDVDRLAVEELLATSEEAREELRSFAEVAAALAVGATGADPTQGLRDRIIESARAERQVVVPFAPRAGRVRLAPMLVATTAIAATIALALGIWGLSLSHDLNDTRAALDQQQSVGGVLSDPTARTVSLSSDTGRLVVASSGQAVLIFDGIAAAPPGKAYQIWVLENGAAKAAGYFSGGSGRAVVPVEVPVEVGNFVAVTVENAGGVTKPTTKPFVTSSAA